jgi:amino acid transporter
LFSVALYIASMAEVGQGRTLERVEIAAIAWAVNIFAGIVNTIGTKAIGRMSTLFVWWTLGGTVFLVVSLLVKAPVKVNSISQVQLLSHEVSFGLLEFCRLRIHEFSKVSILTLRKKGIMIGRLSASRDGIPKASSCSLDFSRSGSILYT